MISSHWAHPEREDCWQYKIYHSRVCSVGDQVQDFKAHFFAHYARRARIDDADVRDAVERDAYWGLMMATKKKSGRPTKALLETACDMRASGILDATAHDKITLRHLCGKTASLAASSRGGLAGTNSKPSKHRA